MQLALWIGVVQTLTTSKEGSRRASALKFMILVFILEQGETRLDLNICYNQREFDGISVSKQIKRVRSSKMNHCPYSISGNLKIKDVETYILSAEVVDHTPKIACMHSQKSYLGYQH